MKRRVPPMPEHDTATNSAARESSVPVAEQAKGQRGFLLSILGLIVGVVAIGLASIPAIAFDKPLPNPFAEEQQEKVEPPAEREGGVTLKYKSFSVQFGGKAVEKKPAPEPEPEVAHDPVRWFTVAAIGCALVGIVIAGVGQLRERHTPVTVAAMGCCVAAIAWQYLVVGIAVGVAVAVCLILLVAIGSALGG